MSFFKKIGYTSTLAAIDGSQLAVAGFLVMGPLVWRGMNNTLTRMCVNMAQSWTATIVFTGAILIWVLQLFLNYKLAHGRFEMEPLLDRQEAQLAPQGKGAWIAEFRQEYRRRQFVSLIASTLIICTIIMYYEIWVIFSVIARRHIQVMKGACAGIPLNFSFLEKIFLGQFTKDLPFGINDMINMYGKCAPDKEAFAVKMTTTLADSLHWFLILFVVGYLWRKQIKTWLLPPKAEEKA
ncbi:MAG: hypothetical protein NVSMB62_14200 [Acidobacteriaceae bacterium]